MEIKQLILKILDKQDELKNEMSDIKVIQARHEVNLREHMRRSAANEEAVNILRKEFQPIKKHVIYVEGFFKILGLLVTLTAGVLGIIKAIDLVN